MQLNTPFSDSVPQDPSQGRLAGEHTCRCEYPHTTYRMILLVFNCNVIHIILQFTSLNGFLIGIRTTVIYSLYFFKILTAMTIFHCRTLSWVFFFFSIFCWWVFWLFLIFRDERAIVNLLVHISLCVGEGESPGLGVWVVEGCYAFLAGTPVYCQAALQRGFTILSQPSPQPPATSLSVRMAQAPYSQEHLMLSDFNIFASLVDVKLYFTVVFIHVSWILVRLNIFTYISLPFICVSLSVTCLL